MEAHWATQLATMVACKLNLFWYDDENDLGTFSLDMPPIYLY